MTTRTATSRLLALAAALGACEPTVSRPAKSAAADRPGAELIADAVDVTTIDSAGLGGVPMCAPLARVNLVFHHAVDTAVYCPEDGCDTPYPAKFARTRAGDTLVFESSPSSEDIDRDRGVMRVYAAYTRSPRIRTGLGTHAGMTVGQVRALGERVDVDTSGVVVRADDSGDADGVPYIEAPRVLRLLLPLSGVIAEVHDSVDHHFSRHLAPGRPVQNALDTAARISALGVVRACR